MSKYSGGGQGFGGMGFPGGMPGGGFPGGMPSYEDEDEPEEVDEPAPGVKRPEDDLD
jgi:hypothetical protein